MTVGSEAKGRTAGRRGALQTHNVRVLVHHMLFGAGFKRPHPHGLVVAAATDQGPAGVRSGGSHPLRVPLDRSDIESCSDLPNADRRVSGSRDQMLAARGEGDR